MTDKNLVSDDRRKLMKAAAAGAGAAALFGGLGVNPLMAAALAEAAGRSEKPLKAAFSNAGLQATWCAQGKQAAEYWGKLFNVDVTWFDGQLDAVKQRSAIDNMASQKWDFVAIQAFGIGTLTAPVNKMIDAGIPVIDMDTLIAPLDTINVHTLLAPDNEFMGASVTQALVNAINGEGTIVMTQGALGHTGAQGRAKGFHSVVSKFPKIQVLDEQPADWDVTKVARIWEALLDQISEDRRGLLPQRRHGARGLQGDAGQGPHRDQDRRRRRHAAGDQGGAGRARCTRPCATRPAASMAARSSPASQAVVNGAKTGAGIPKNIVTDGPVVTKANADGMLWMEEQFLI